MKIATAAYRRPVVGKIREKSPLTPLLILGKAKGKRPDFAILLLRLAEMRLKLHQIYVCAFTSPSQKFHCDKSKRICLYGRIFFPVMAGGLCDARP